MSSNTRTVIETRDSRSALIEKRDQAILRGIDRFPEKSSADIVKALTKPLRRIACAEDVHRLRLASGKVYVNKVAGPKNDAGKKSKRIGITVAKFKAKFDPDTRMHAQLAEGIKWLAKHKEIIPDAEFRVRCSCRAIGWKETVQEPRYRNYRFVVKNQRYWANPKVREEILNEVQGAKPE